MARQPTVLDIFIASPADVSEERQVVREVAQELTASLRKRDIQLYVVSAETDVAPGIGIDAQNVINESLADQYDILIGIMWTRYGTPTGRAESGTVEEFERAHRRWVKDPDSIRIMFYFKEEPISPADIDPEQLEKVMGFRARLEAEYGTFYKRFKSTGEFGDLVRLDLALHVEDFGTVWGTSIPRGGRQTIVGPMGESVDQFVQPPEMSDVGNESEPAFPELLEQSAHLFGSSAALLADLGREAQKLHKVVRREKRDLVIAGPPATTEVVDRRRTIGRIARAMDSLAAELRTRVPQFSTKRSEGVNILGIAVALVADRDIGERLSPDVVKAVEAARDNSIELGRMVESTLSTISSVRKTVASIAPTSTGSKQARRMALEALDTAYVELDTAGRLALEAASATAHLLKSRGEHPSEGQPVE
jgi:hypothetical protein